MFPNNFPNNCNQYPFQFPQQSQGNQNPTDQYASYPQPQQQTGQSSQQMSMPTYFYQYPPIQNYPLMTQNNGYQSYVTYQQNYPTYQQNARVQVNPNPQPVIAASSTQKTDKPQTINLQQSQSQSDDLEEANDNGCICTKTGCIKEYCKCFKSGKSCNQQCRCIDCRNTKEREIKKFKSIQIHNKQVKCNCKKSKCSNKYCDCLSNSRQCNQHCKCTDCSNH